MFTTTDTRARFEEKARSHPEPRAEDAFNEIASPSLVTHAAGLKNWFLARGLEAEFSGVLEGLFEAIGQYPLEDGNTAFMTLDHQALRRLHISARQAFERKYGTPEERLAQARKGEAA